MKELKLSKRLNTVAQFVRDGAVVADIGTDHAYIPIYLMLNGIAKHAIASDINEGPIARARENISQYKLEKSITTCVTNGLDGIPSYQPTDILICGMGGELIAQILDSCDYIKNPKIKLILQPMTSIYELRSYLTKGFCISEEAIVCEDGKYYQIICAFYDGKHHEFTDVELELGKRNIEGKENIFYDFLDFSITKKQKIINGLIKGGCDTAHLESQIKEMEGLK
ncbi:MAG: SAM-dependent methyltransferase [Clostridia bacterium]|nr:SAM-dependent methyltransferase [Clostridia bacterium]